MLEEIRKEAQELLKDRVNWGVLEGGTESGATVAANEAAFRSIAFVPKLIHAVQPSLECEFFGHKINTPIMIAPLSGLIEFVCKEPYMELAKASEALSCALWIGYPCKVDVKKIVSRTGAPVVRIIKPLQDRKKLLSELLAAEGAGCRAVGIDIDACAGVKIGSTTMSYGGLSPLSEEELRSIKKEISAPFILKGVLSRDDAKIADEIGAEGIVVSNHGGRVLDTCVPPVKMLPIVAEIFGGTVFADSGFRSGGDVLKALALGAQGALAGRAVIYGLAKKSEGVVRVIENMNKELMRCMVLTGTESVRRVSRGILA